MRQATPKRFVIVGLPGSGKSTFATKLGILLDIPVHHLDKFLFISKGKKRDRQEFLALQKATIEEKSWIIEGCSISTLEMRLAQTDVLLYFLFPRVLCLWRLLKRIFTYENLSHTGCLRGVDWILLKYLWNFKKEKSQEVEKLSRKYAHVDFRIFRSSKEADKYLTTLKRSTKNKK